MTIYNLDEENLEATNILDQMLTDKIIFDFENRHWTNKEQLWKKWIRS